MCVLNSAMSDLNLTNCSTHVSFSFISMYIHCIEFKTMYIKNVSYDEAYLDDSF